MEDKELLKAIEKLIEERNKYQNELLILQDELLKYKEKTVKRFDLQRVIDFSNMEDIEVGNYVLTGNTVRELEEQVNGVVDKHIFILDHKNKYTFNTHDIETLGQEDKVPYLYKLTEEETEEVIETEDVIETEESSFLSEKVVTLLCKIKITADNTEDAENRLFNACDSSDEEMNIVILDKEVEK